MPNELPPIPIPVIESQTGSAASHERRPSTLEQVTSPLLPQSAWETTSQKDQAKEKWRRTLGLALLAFTVFLWTASNFLASVRDEQSGARVEHPDTDYTCSDSLRRRYLFKTFLRHLRQHIFFHPTSPSNPHPPSIPRPRVLPHPSADMQKEHNPLSRPAAR